MTERFNDNSGDSRLPSIDGLEVTDLTQEVETIVPQDMVSAQIIRFPEERTSPSSKGVEVNEIFLQTKMDRDRLEELANNLNAPISTRINAVGNAMLMASNTDHFVAQD